MGKTRHYSSLAVVIASLLAACVRPNSELEAPPTPSPSLSSTAATDNSGGCVTVIACANMALQAAQAARDAAARAVPVGTVIAFAGTMQAAVAERQNGWWVCDGTPVSDPLAGTYNGKPTPNLTDKFLMAGAAPGRTGGAAKADVTAKPVSVATFGFGNPPIYSDPRLVVSTSLSHVSGSSIYSSGIVRGQSLDILPPYYTVIYLMKVR